MVYHVNDRAFGGGEEAGDLVGIHRLRVGDVDQLVIGRNAFFLGIEATRSEEHTSELQSLMRISYAVFCLKKKNQTKKSRNTKHIAIYKTFKINNRSINNKNNKRQIRHHINSKTSHDK